MSHDLQTVKQRTVSLLAGGDGDGEHRRQAVAALEARVAQILARPAAHLAWPPAAEEADFNQTINRLLGGVRTLAEGYRSRGGRYEGDGQVLERALAGLDNALELFNPDTPRPGNWYYWVIQIPDKLGAVGLLLEDRLPPDLRARLETALTHDLRDMTLSGANGSWEARNHAYLALLLGDGERLGRAAARVFEAVSYTTDTGVREDFSYLFHGRIPYAGVYGGFVETVAQFAYLLDGTAWAPSQGQTQLLARTLLEHFRWFVVGGVFDPVVCGRAYEQQRRAGEPLAVLLFLGHVAQVDPELRQRLRGAAAELLAQGTRSDAALAAMADDLAGVPPEPPRGFRYWYAADLGAYVAPDYHVGVRLYSRRVQDYEYLTRMGAEGWNLAYGFTHVSRSGHEWYDGPRGARPVADLDPDHLAGTTSRVGAHPRNDVAGSESSYGHSLNFGRGELSGGAGIDAGGMVAFELVPTHGDFVARKSVTFFPGGFLAVGSGITSQAPAGEDRPVHTTLLQWVAPSPEIPLVVDGFEVELSTAATRLVGVRWACIDSVGLALPRAADLWARRQGRVTTVWLDHGPSPQDVGYVYALLPATTEEAVARFAEAPPVRALRRDDAAHVVVDEVTGSQAAACFAPGVAAGFSVEAPAVVYLRGDGAAGAVSVQGLAHAEQELRVGLPVRPAAALRSVDPEVSADPDADGPGLGLRVAARLGRIYRAAWGKAAADLQPVPRVDLAELHAFRAEVEADAQRAVFTVHLPESAVRDGYDLTMLGRQGLRIHRFGEDDVVDRPAPGVVRYVWQHGQGTAAADGETQREGDFRLILTTGLKSGTAFVSIPHVDAAGRAQPSALPRDVNRPPAP